MITHMNTHHHTHTKQVNVDLTLEKFDIPPMKPKLSPVSESQHTSYKTM